MTDIDYTIVIQRIARAAVRCVEANAEFARLYHDGVAEDEADELSGLSAVSDELMDSAIAARDCGNGLVAAAAAMLVEEAGLSFDSVQLPHAA